MRAQTMLETGEFEFLAGAVDLVVVEAEPHQQGLQPEHAFEAFDHRDRGAAADQDRRLGIFLGQGGAGGGDDGKIGRDRDARRRAIEGVVEFEIGMHARGKKLLERGEDRFRILAGDEAEGNFRAGLGRDHGFCARAGIAAPDAVEIGGRARPKPLERATPGLARWGCEPDIAEKRRHIEAERRPGGFLLG